MNSKKIILLGMHRSGTSATAGWLHHMGINMGEKMLEKNANNQKGHYEDMELLNFHLDLANELKLHNWKVLQDIDITDVDSFNNRAKKLINKRDESYSQWGWKEPRMVMYMNYWQPLLQDAYYIIIYRHYSLVASSLVSREIRNLFKRIGLKPNQKAISIFNQVLNRRKKKYIDLWISYNKKLLNFYYKNNENTIVLEFNELIKNPESAKSWLIKSGFDIVEQDDFFDRNLIGQINLENNHKEASELFEKFKSLSKIHQKT